MRSPLVSLTRARREDKLHSTELRAGASPTRLRLPTKSKGRGAQRLRFKGREAARRATGRQLNLQIVKSPPGHQGRKGAGERRPGEKLTDSGCGGAVLSPGLFADKREREVDLVFREGGTMMLGVLILDLVGIQEQLKLNVVYNERTMRHTPRNRVSGPGAAIKEVLALGPKSRSIGRRLRPVNHKRQ